MVLLLLQHVALASIVEVGVPPSICHLPPARGVRGVSHAKCLVTLPLVIQAGCDLRSAVRIEKVQPRYWGKVWW